MINYKIETTPAGHKAIPMSQIDVVSIFGGYGICDHCGKAKVHGYLVPVLGSKWNCDECHADFIKTAKFYPEDVPFEERALASFVARIERYEFLTSTKIQITEKEALQRYEADMSENGWQPSAVRELSCSCHISAPCSKCCLDGDYFDEWCEEHNVEIIESTFK